ncbi:DinB family protein [Deinococcus proteolyticus MRP]|uniref:DinB family protein n=1 Tax=Deinococcus proteolyticus (strain ATCC 35074 / DSM 20540 / JCM 6276 / NBRC 101906 / NCIMB 13154 / VKM Ac-1939 / CCM 2703 / MRP) TaxID=693977 RepID=F0RP42_DEIPM|nr:DinB family protein [Deinococcus proteolyticus]ADY25357.1 DinB family protein [Deinococcus proteolyticus MRP]
MSEITLQTPATLLTHWQGHRDLTRRTIEAFPEEGFGQHAAPGMRPFQMMALEILGMMDYQLEWLRSGKPHWEDPDPEQKLPSRAEILQRWDKQTAELAETFPKVGAETWLTPVDTPFGRMSPFKSAEYLIENEIHHRAQGFVYLRELGVTPPGFYERGDVTEE